MYKEYVDGATVIPVTKNWFYGWAGSLRLGVMKDGKEVEITTSENSITYVTTGKKVTLTKLPAGEYTLTETTAPEGYTTAESITFKIDTFGRITDKDNKVLTEVVMEDAVQKSGAPRRYQPCDCAGDPQRNRAQAIYVGLQ